MKLTIQLNDQESKALREFTRTYNEYILVLGGTGEIRPETAARFILTLPSITAASAEVEKSIAAKHAKDAAGAPTETMEGAKRP